MEVINIINIDQTDSCFIRKLRKINDDSGDKICKKLGINRTYFYYVEKGDKKYQKIY